MYLLGDCRDRCAHPLQAHRLGRSALCDHLLNLIWAQDGKRNLKINRAVEAQLLALLHGRNQNTVCVLTMKMTGAKIAIAKPVKRMHPQLMHVIAIMAAHAQS